MELCVFAFNLLSSEEIGLKIDARAVDFSVGKDDKALFDYFIAYFESQGFEVASILELFGGKTEADLLKMEEMEVPKYCNLFYADSDVLSKIGLREVQYS